MMPTPPAESARTSVPSRVYFRAPRKWRSFSIGRQLHPVAHSLPRRVLLQVLDDFPQPDRDVGGDQHRVVFHPLLLADPAPVGLLEAGDLVNELDPPVVLVALGVG